MLFQPLAMRNVRWAPVAGEGLEQLHLTATPDAVVARSVVIGGESDAPFAAFYEIRCDLDWRVRSFRIEATHGDALAMDSPEPGRWRMADGTSRPDLDGCIDIDLSATPFTNTLPIRRLGAALTDVRELRMLYVPFDTFEPIAEAQRYRAIEAGRLYRFEAADGGFAADLPVDDDGLVLDYPTLFRRL